MKSALFLDIETTGLDPNKEEILEVAFVLVDTQAWVPVKTKQLLTLTPSALERVNNRETIDPYVRNMHAKSGLWQQIDYCAGIEGYVQDYEAWGQLFLEELKQWGVKNQPIWGSSVAFDRKFLAHHMPELDSYFHYRIVDSSGVMERLRATNPSLAKAIANDPTKLNGVGTKHRALDDIMYSVDLERLLDKHLYSKVLR